RGRGLVIRRRRSSRRRLGRARHAGRPGAGGTAGAGEQERDAAGNKGGAGHSPKDKEFARASPGVVLPRGVTPLLVALTAPCRSICQSRSSPESPRSTYVFAVPRRDDGRQ